MTTNYMVQLVQVIIDSAAQILSYPDFRFIITLGLACFVLDKIFTLVFKNFNERSM